MAKNGGLFIAGNDEREGIFKSGMVFTLSQAPNFDYIYSTRCNQWEIEFASGSIDIVVRGKTPLHIEQLKKEGFEKIQEALDIIAITKNFYCRLDSASRTHVGVYASKGKSILYIYSKVYFPIAINCEAKITGSQGNALPDPGLAPTFWHKTIRYYRLSQVSIDIYEAYRNLFLALESLLHSLQPKRSKEGEAKWLERSLAFVSKKVALQQFAMPGKNPPVIQIIKKHYYDIRCKIQHAKNSATLPYSQIEPDSIQDGYEQLLRLWRLIAAEYIKLPLNGGFMPYQTFENHMHEYFSKEYSVHFTNDPSPCSAADTSVSPRGEPTFSFEHSNYLGKIRPGAVRIEASSATKANPERFSHPIHRIACLVDQNIGPILSMNPGILVTGVDEFRCIIDWKIENTSMPKVNF